MGVTNFTVVKSETMTPYTVTSADATAGTVTLDLSTFYDFSDITGVIAQVTRAGAVVTEDLNISYTGKSLTFADGTTYALTTADIITYISF